MHLYHPALGAHNASSARGGHAFAAGASRPGASRSSAPPPFDSALSAFPLHELSFERNGFTIRIANGCESLKRQTALLIERMYSARGLFAYGTRTELDKRDITVVALQDERAVATLTVRMDHGSGLLADTLYQKEIDAVRATGGRVCEITQLAIDSGLESHDALAGLLQALYTLARMTERMTDIFIEVHPRHANFYQRVFGYRRVGVEKICLRVGAAAVLLHLSQHDFEHALARHERAEERRRCVRRLMPSKTEVQRLLERFRRR